MHENSRAMNLRWREACFIKIQ